MRLGLAQIAKTDNGYTVRYPEAIQREHPVPSSLMGMDDGQIEVMVEMNMAATEDSEWNESQLEERREKARVRLREIRDQFATRTQPVWMIEMREWQFPAFAGLIKALEAADKAHEQLMGLIRSGTVFVGPLQPMMLAPTTGPQPF